MTARPLARESLSEQIHRSLRTSLMDGEYKPGDRLTIAGLAASYGTSITPVREAITRLASEHALEVKAATSVTVPLLTPVDLHEIVDIRRDLEGRAAARVASIADDAMLRELEAANAEFAQAAADGDAARSARTNREFHFAILRLARMPYVEAVCENMWTLMGPFLRAFHEKVPRRRLASDDHGHFRFLQAVRDRDSDAARAAMQADIDWSRELIPETISGS